VGLRPFFYVTSEDCRLLARQLYGHLQLGKVDCETYPHTGGDG